MGNGRGFAQGAWEGPREHSDVYLHKDVEFRVKLLLWELGWELSSKRQSGSEDFNCLFLSASRNSFWWQVFSIPYLIGSEVSEARVLYTCDPRGISSSALQTLGVPSRRPLSWALTTLVEEGPGLTRHTLKAAVVETHDDSLVPFKTVAGAHGRRHLQEATGVLNMAQVKGHARVEWAVICFQCSFPGQSPWFCKPAAANHLGVAWEAALVGLDRAMLF